MKCDGRVHNLVDIHSFPATYDSEAVVRWCQDCGAVVIDLDCDNRTSPGAIERMRFPSMTYPNQRLLKQKD